MADPIQLQYQMPGWHHIAAGSVRPAVSFLRKLGSIGWWLLVSGLAVFLLTAFASGVFGGFPALLLVIALIPTIATALNQARARRAAAILGYVHQAIRLNVPLGRLVAAAARSETGKLQRRLMELKACLDLGMPLWEAIAAVPEMPARLVEIVRYAEQIGRLPRTLDRLIHEEIADKRRSRTDRALMIWYPPMLLLIANGVLAVISIFVFPKFQGIFKDSHAQLPAVARVVLDWDQQAIFFVPVLVFIVWFAFSLRVRETLRLRPREPLLRALWDRILWMVPVYGGMLRECGMADLCTVLADATELGYPLDQAVGRATSLQLNCVLKRRVQRWREQLAAGAVPAEAAREAQLPRFLIGMLNTARAGDDLPDILRFVARFYRDRSVVLREVLIGAYLPVVTLIMGTMVAFVMLSVFVPLYKLVLIYGNPKMGGF
jgi:type IV pilus assembly protein PilC